eukprot:CAMPEP_0116821998 /NCGR_PEP_ID=MMETSP0418-20121206/24_1 /TAXON_ID=1158023 /ORGANISM="Astrosyne radiata, Strain 13vi08-1A" /LENGTH=313 /DNA_ID=CAMNT_0004450063 /DNA_START=19 /DNA_END=961 /DNA_ORIENTATION=-
MVLGAVATKTRLFWLDLRGSGLSVLERLCLEESLLRCDGRNWAIVGTHEPVTNRFLRIIEPGYVLESESRNTSCVIVMGIGGKPKELLDVEKVQRDGVLVLKRFSGGGTVVMDHNAIWTTWIGRSKDFPKVEPFPRPLMKWTADTIFGPTFDRLKQQALAVDVKQKSMGGAENSGRVFQVSATRPAEIPNFCLRENDYVLGERKMGGNSQSLTKDGWLHHTSFLWDFDTENMEYLTLPTKRPEYRSNRSHEDFLVKLGNVYPGLRPNHFVSSMKSVSTELFDLETTRLQDAMAVVDDMQQWFDDTCRTKVVDL